jgi:hypothetical protein
LEWEVEVGERAKVEGGEGVGVNVKRGRKGGNGREEKYYGGD